MMNMRLRSTANGLRAGFLGVAAIVAATLIATAAPPVISEDLRTAIRNKVDYGYNPGISMGVVNADGRAFFSYGVSSLENLMPSDEHTLYEIASVTKVLTSLLLADTVARGETELDEPVKSLFGDREEVAADQLTDFR